MGLARDDGKLTNRDPEMPLWKAHDISQDLQDQIEALPNVDRCFVHVDHEVDHKPEHRKKQ